MSVFAVRASLAYVLAVSIAGHASAAQAEQGSDSADAVVPALNAALSGGDVGSVVGLIDPVDHPRTIAHALGMVQGLAAAGGRMDEFNAIVSGNALQPLLEPDGPYAQGVEETRQFFEGKNAPDILGQVLAFTTELGGDQWLRILVLPAGDCTGLKVQGQTASCSIDGQEVRLTQNGGRWFLDLDHPE
jgi:hypothetical protein